MMTTNPPYELPSCDPVFTAEQDAGGSAIPIYAVRGAGGLDHLQGLTEAQRMWITAHGFKGGAKASMLLPGTDGSIAAVLFGLGQKEAGEPSGPAELLIGDLPRRLPAGTYALHGGWADMRLASIAWGLGSYAFRAYKSKSNDDAARLVIPAGIDDGEVRRTTAAIWLGRDLVNTPSNDMGPAELERTARLVAERHGASASAIIGDDLIQQNFPLIHAVGRASSRSPRLIDIRWGRQDAPRVTIIGKGVCFDTGGLDIKPPAAMQLMKKDMGGAASALALADMVMGANLDVHLRLLIPAVENSIGGNAFRPGDIVRSRAGITVEIGNTDAEGRLVLADALSLADEEKPHLMMTFATLTGAARVALGPDLPPYFSDDDLLAARIAETGLGIGDPVWRLPFWAGYDRTLDSDDADMNNISNGPFAGAVTAALFLKRFVKKATQYVHFDIYGWRPARNALGPKGGEPHAARTMFEVIKEIAAKGQSDG